MINLSRRPVRPGPRLEGWVVFAIVWGGAFGVLILTYSLLSNPFLSLGAALIVGVIGTVAGWTWNYSIWRLEAGTDVYSDAMMATGEPIGDPARARRVADLQERSAWKRYKRGAITRVEYERLMARRRFAHGEMSSEEYHELMRELGAASGTSTERLHTVPSHHEPR